MILYGCNLAKTKRSRKHFYAVASFLLDFTGTSFSLLKTKFDANLQKKLSLENIKIIVYNLLGVDGYFCFFALFSVVFIPDFFVKYCKANLLLKIFLCCCFMNYQNNRVPYTYYLLVFIIFIEG